MAANFGAASPCEWTTCFGGSNSMCLPLLATLTRSANLTIGVIFQQIEDIIDDAIAEDRTATH